ncbi:MAG: hypothetical protein WCC69_11820, partial [Pirellulales bacterium]
MRAVRDWNDSLASLYRAGLLMNPYPTDGDWDPEVWQQMALWYDALVMEYNEITDAIDDLASRSTKMSWLTVVADQMAAAFDVVDTDPGMPPEVFDGPTTPTDGGLPLPGLRGLSARRPGSVTPPVPDGVPAAATEAARKTPMPWDDLALFAAKVGKVLLVFGGYVAANILYDKFLASPSERAAQESEWMISMAKKRAEALAACPTGDQACRDSVNRWFDMMTKAGQCDLLDTPVADVIGGVVGIGVGYLGLKRGMGG